MLCCCCCCCLGDASAGGDPQLWGEALEYFCGQPHDCAAAISEVLTHIEAGALLPPLVVLQTLAKNKQLKVLRWQRFTSVPFLMAWEDKLAVLLQTIPF